MVLMWGETNRDGILFGGIVKNFRIGAEHLAEAGTAEFIPPGFAGWIRWLDSLAGFSGAE